MRETNPLRESDGRDADLDLIFERVRQTRLRLRPRLPQRLIQRLLQLLPQRLHALIASVFPQRGD